MASRPHGAALSAYGANHGFAGTNAFSASTDNPNGAALNGNFPSPIAGNVGGENSSQTPTNNSSQNTHSFNVQTVYGYSPQTAQHPTGAYAYLPPSSASEFRYSPYGSTAPSAFRHAVASGGHPSATSEAVINQPQPIPSYGPSSPSISAAAIDSQNPPIPINHGYAYGTNGGGSGGVFPAASPQPPLGVVPDIINPLYASAVAKVESSGSRAFVAASAPQPQKVYDPNLFIPALQFPVGGGLSRVEAVDAGSLQKQRVG